ncbi:WXG100 family type VII secretion target [Paenibacillus illinoisensis]|uniref:WXG100 family type VII secretion target n=1 Tax=Paenibacillus illinoisensis TaxID=59845 RepID=UPI001C8EDE65|nr:WXG100 family type VII secretion target [Paenibacillus illinoisensis]MBY0216066.1 WXG100 family type VII secretion target [Paenibacillus illinoisensis]
MTTIKVTPQQLSSVSKQFAVAQSQVFQMNSILKQHLFEIERQWDGSTKEKFYVDFVVAQKIMDNFVSLSQSISKELEGHAEKFRLADQQAVQSYDSRCAPPPPDECRAPSTDNRNAFQKSADSLAELGRAFMQSADDRYQKRYDSVGGFLDYWTFGIPSGLVQGYVDRADKAFNSPNDTANWLTFGIHGTIREATMPTNAWSSEHWANMIGMGGLMVGTGYASSMIKPHNLLTSSGGGTRVNSFSHPGTGSMMDKGRLNAYGDALRENLGSAVKSHPDEYSSILRHAEELGVKVDYRSGTLAYEPSFSSPGRLILDPEASIGAVRHEYRHMLDDFDLGHPGMRVIADSDLFWRLEYRGYMEEIKLAREIRDFDAGRFILQEMRARRQEILGR